MAGVVGPASFVAPGLDGARIARLPDLTDAGTTVQQLVLMVASRSDVFTIHVVGALDRMLDPVAVLVAVGRRQQTRAGGAPPPLRRRSRTEARLDRLLLPAPPESGLTAVPVRFDPDLEPLRDIARSQRVIDVLERNEVVRARGFVAPHVQIYVVLDRLPYDLFAAVGLGVAGNTRRWTDLPRAVGLPDGVASRSNEPGFHEATVMFRRGEYLVTVGAKAEIQAIAPDLLDRVTADFARRQAQRLPAGATEPYFFPSNARAIVSVIGLTTGVGLIAVGLGRVRARRHRRLLGRVDGAGRGSVRDAPGVLDVSADGRTLRRRGLVLVAAQIVVLNLMVVGVLGLLGVLEAVPVWLSVVLVAAGLLGGLGFTRWWRRGELGAIGPPGGTAGTWSPALAGFSAGTVSLALLIGGLALLTWGLAGMAFGPALSMLKWADDLSIDPEQLSVAVAVTGAVLVVVGGAAFRLARMWSRVSAERLRQRDRRPAILCLRSFEDDQLSVATVLSARRPLFELFRLRGTDPFEEAITWEIAPYGPVVAVGRPGRSLASLGAAREYLPEDRWRDDVAELMHEARAIVMTIGETDGLRWEVERVAAADHVGKTIFVLPPLGPDTLHDRWRFTADALHAAGVDARPLPDDAARAFTAVLDPSGTWRVTVADVRDEATYRTAVDRSMEWLSNTKTGAPSTLG
jgi:hypothetical protein